MSTPTIDTLLEYCERHSNWGRWGPEDEMGTLNIVTPEMVRNAATLVKKGTPISMALPFDEHGPQTGGLGRFNPIHLMIRDGADAVAGTSIRDFYGGVDKHFRGTDDIIIMPLQSGTQWDALGHVVYHETIYNGYSADQVSSKGAMKGDVTQAANSMVGRGVLLDMPRALGVDWLEPGHAIDGEQLDRAAAMGNIEIGAGDFVFIRTGAMAKVAADGGWTDYAGGDAPGLGLGSIDWIAERERGCSCDRHLGSRSTAQRNTRRRPTTAHRVHRVHGPVARRDLRLRTPRGRLCRGRRVRIHVLRPTAALHQSSRQPPEPNGNQIVQLSAYRDPPSRTAR